MQAKDLMRTRVLTVHVEDTVGDLVDFLIQEHIHGAPVLDDDGKLVGMVSQQDAYFSAMTHDRDGKDSAPPKVREIMTSPAVSVSDDSDIRSLCETMYRLKLHRLPVLRQGKIVGIISSLDICRAISEGKSLD